MADALDNNEGNQKGKSQNKEQMVGQKYLFRNALSLQIMGIFAQCGILVNCLKMNCRAPNAAYNNFVSSFHELYLTTALSTNDSNLLKLIEAAFDGDWGYKTKADWRKKSFQFINLFKAYLVQIKKDGLYNPEITRKDNSQKVWQDSI